MTNKNKKVAILIQIIPIHLINSAASWNYHHHKEDIQNNYELRKNHILKQQSPDDYQ
jgi:hypothetical protein